MVEEIEWFEIVFVEIPLLEFGMLPVSRSLVLNQKNPPRQKPKSEHAP